MRGLRSLGHRLAVVPGRHGVRSCVDRLVLAHVVVIVVAFLVLGAARRSVTAAGDGASRGAKLFATLPCASCHDVGRPWPGGDICPNLGNIATEAGRIVRDSDYRGRAKDAAGYIRESILDPDAYIVPGARYRQADGRSVMPRNFGQTLTAAELDDLVAFLLTRR